MPETAPGMSPKMVMTLIIVGLLLWGLYLSIGTLVYGINPRGALVIMGCVGGFVGIWLGLMALRNRRLRNP